MKTKALTLAVAAALFPATAVWANSDLSALEARINDLESRLAQTEQTAQQAQDTASSFEFHGYARAGLLVNDYLNGANGTGPYMTAAGALGAPVGRLGLEDDNYLEANLIHNRTMDDGSSARFHIMLADSVETNNEWTADDSQLNVRQVYAELSNLSSFSGRLNTQRCGLVSALIAITLTSTFLTRTSCSFLAPAQGFMMCNLPNTGKPTFLSMAATLAKSTAPAPMSKTTLRP